MRCEADHTDGGVCLAQLAPAGWCPREREHSSTSEPATVPGSTTHGTWVTEPLTEPTHESTLSWAPSGCHPGCRDLTVGDVQMQVFDADLPGRNHWYVDCDGCGTVVHTGTGRGLALVEALLHSLRHIEPATVAASP